MRFEDSLIGKNCLYEGDEVLVIGKDYDDGLYAILTEKGGTSLNYFYENYANRSNVECIDKPLTNIEYYYWVDKSNLTRIEISEENEIENLEDKPMIGRIYKGLGQIIGKTNYSDSPYIVLKNEDDGYCWTPSQSDQDVIYGDFTREELKNRCFYITKQGIERYEYVDYKDLGYKGNKEDSVINDLAVGDLVKHHEKGNGVIIRIDSLGNPLILLDEPKGREIFSSESEEVDSKYLHRGKRYWIEVERDNITKIKPQKISWSDISNLGEPTLLETIYKTIKMRLINGQVIQGDRVDGDYNKVLDDILVEINRNDIKFIKFGNLIVNIAEISSVYCE